MVVVCCLCQSELVVVLLRYPNSLHMAGASCGDHTPYGTWVTQWLGFWVGVFHPKGMLGN